MASIDFIKASRQQLEQVMDKLEETNNKIDVNFEKERLTWKNELMPLYEILRNLDKTAMADLQASTLSLRHRIQDKITYYMSQLSKNLPKHKSAVGDRFEYYLTGFGIKVGSEDKKRFVERDMAQRKRSIELLENHIEFLRECRYSCDQIQYAVKNVVGIAQYLA